MTEQRCLPGDLCMADAMPFQQHWECRTTWPLADVLNDQFLLNQRNQVRPGDSITICRYDGRDPNHKNVKLLEVATVRVIASGEKAEAVPLAVMFKAAMAGADVAPRSLKVERGFAGKFRLVDGETLIEEFGSKSEAEDAFKKLMAA